MEKMEGRLQTQDQCFLGAKVWKRGKNISKDVLDPSTGLLVRCMQYQSVTLSPYKYKFDIKTVKMGSYLEATIDGNVNMHLRVISIWATVSEHPRVFF
ncbi:hypothetical protein UPYG_G00078900 [Umbra pygmaea]|uniref:Uncharacterized protein n=1 Tax=Umbra pygmaea TaxID=75934 RepID=A0ABD0XUZ8_UMBPY